MFLNIKDATHVTETMNKTQCIFGKEQRATMQNLHQRKFFLSIFYIL